MLLVVILLMRKIYSTLKVKWASLYLLSQESWCTLYLSVQQLPQVAFNLQDERAF